MGGDRERGGEGGIGGDRERERGREVTGHVTQSRLLVLRSLIQHAPKRMERMNDRQLEFLSSKD